MYHVFHTFTPKKNLYPVISLIQPLLMLVFSFVSTWQKCFVSEELPHIQQRHFQSLDEVGFHLNHLRHIIARALHQS